MPRHLEISRARALIAPTVFLLALAILIVAFQTQVPAVEIVSFERLSLDGQQRALWSDNQLQILGGVALLVAQGVLIGVLLVERRTRRLAQAKLSEAEQRYRTVADFTVDLEYWTKPDGSLAYVSPSCLEITGYERAELMQRPELMAELVLESDREAWESRHRIASTTARPPHLECRIRCKNGDVKWVDLVVSPVASSDGHDLGVRGSVRDITTMKQSEEELQRAVDANRQLRDQLEIDNTYLREEVQSGVGLDGILGSSKVMNYVVSRSSRSHPHRAPCCSSERRASARACWQKRFTIRAPDGRGHW